MREKTIDKIFFGVLFIVSTIAVFDLFLHSGLPITFDNPVHTTNIAQFYLALRDLDIPVRWADGFANYGLPIPIVAHQVTSYLGATLLFLGITPELSLKILYFLAFFLSAVTFYLFLRRFFQPFAACSGAFLYTFSSYKIFNLYVRGALPELFSAMFLPLILLGIMQFWKEGRLRGLLLVTIAIALLALNHPMMLLIYSFIYIPFFFWQFFQKRNIKGLSFSLQDVKKVILLGMAVITGLLIAGFYLIPLLREIKYFYYGITENTFNTGSFLKLENFISNAWPYFTSSEIGPRGHLVTVGLIESSLFLAGIIFFGVQLVRKKRDQSTSILTFALVAGLILLFLMLPISEWFFIHINLLGNIQFQWRILSAFIFIPPLILAYFLSLLQKPFYSLLAILVISIMIFPQLYGKNYIRTNQQQYFFTPFNVHSVMMNTIWTDKTENYPVKREKGEIIHGTGKIVKRIEQNSQREYMVSGTTPLRLVDYTFYFPGWNVYVDGQKTPIEFQDPNYRGVITYNVPQGDHKVKVLFENTRIRLVSNIASLAGLVILFLGVLTRKRIKKLLKV